MSELTAKEVLQISKKMLFLRARIFRPFDDQPWKIGSKLFLVSGKSYNSEIFFIVNSEWTFNGSAEFGAQPLFVQSSGFNTEESATHMLTEILECWPNQFAEWPDWMTDEPQLVYNDLGLGRRTSCDKMSNAPLLTVMHISRLLDVCLERQGILPRDGVRHSICTRLMALRNSMLRPYQAVGLLPS